MSDPSVTALSLTAIKGTRIRQVDEIILGRSGAVGDRPFFLIDGRGRMVNGKVFAALQTVTTTWDADEGRLTITFPGGSEVTGAIKTGAPVTAKFFSRQATGRLIEGPWSEALSDHLGAPVRVAELVPEEYRGSAVDRGYAGAISLVSAGSLERLAAQASVGSLDARRFRMLMEIDGVEPHAEDQWVGREARIGATRLRFEGHIGRCLVTSYDPETGVVTLPTLNLLGQYRREVDSTEPLPFGIYGSVLQGGPIRVGDSVALG